MFSDDMVNVYPATLLTCRIRWMATALYVARTYTRQCPGSTGCHILIWLEITEPATLL